MNMGKKTRIQHGLRLLKLVTIISLLSGLFFENAVMAASNDNLFAYNNGFELTPDFTAWSKSSISGATVSVQQSVVHSGTKAAQIVFDGTDKTLEIDRFAQVEAGESYYYESWLKTEGLLSDGFKPQITFMGYKGNTFKRVMFSTDAVMAEQDWTKYSGSFTMNEDEDKVRMLIRRRSGGGGITGSLYADDVVLSMKPDGLEVTPSLQLFSIGADLDLGIMKVIANYGAETFDVSSSVHWSVAGGDGTIDNQYLSYTGDSSGGMVNLSAEYLGTTAASTIQFIQDETPPTAPQHLQAVKVGISSIQLEWDAAEDNVSVAGYDIYLNGEPVAAVTGTQYTANGLSPSTVQSFHVKAKDGAGLQSPFSAELMVSTLSNISPAMAEVDAEHIIKSVSNRMLGYNHDWYQSQIAIMEDEPNSLNIKQEYFDLLEEFQLPMTFHRMAGSDSQFFKWQWAVGDIDERIPQSTWAEPANIYRFGPAEWIKSAQQLDPDAEFVWNFNMRMDTVIEHADAVEYLTGNGLDNPNDGVNWALKRIEAGIVEPVNVIIWELGNELDFAKFTGQFGPDGVENYIQASKQTMEEVRKLNPDAKFAALAKSAPWDNYNDTTEWKEWHRAVLQQMGDEIDYITFHPYYLGYPISKMEQYLDAIRDDILSITGSDRIKVYLSEHSVWPETLPDKTWRESWFLTHALKGILGTAQFYNRMFQREEIVAASYHSFTSGPWGLIYKSAETERLYLTGISDLMKLLSESLGNDVVEVTLSGEMTSPTDPEANLTINAMTTDHGMNLVIVNRDPELNRQITFSGLENYRVVKEKTLTADTLLSHNTGTQEEIRVTTQDVEGQGAFQTYLMPAKSMTVIELETLQLEPDIEPDSGTNPETYVGTNPETDPRAEVGIGPDVTNTDDIIARVEFSDIASHWARNEIKALAAKGIVIGTGDGTFAPNKNTTRAEFVTILARALNWQGTGNAINFADVSDEDWYAEAVRAAFETGIIKGDGKSFFPNAPITREEMATILIRVWKIFRDGIITPSSDLPSSIMDEAEISDWASEAVHQAYALGLLKGKLNDLFAPKDRAARAEVAVVITRLLNALPAK